MKSGFLKFDTKKDASQGYIVQVCDATMLNRNTAARLKKNNIISNILYNTNG
jgi:hypothetical protein